MAYYNDIVLVVGWRAFCCSFHRIALLEANLGGGPGCLVFLFSLPLCGSSLNMSEVQLLTGTFKASIKKNAKTQKNNRINKIGHCWTLKVLSERMSH